MATLKHQSRALPIAVQLVFLTAASGSVASDRTLVSVESVPQAETILEDTRHQIVERAVIIEGDAQGEEPRETTLPRPVRGEEMTKALSKKAREILLGNRGKPVGTRIPFEMDGMRYEGRIEHHYHPPGGQYRPWGHHRGCTVYAVGSVGCADGPLPQS